MIPKEWEVKPLIGLSTEIGDGIHATPTYVKSSESYFVNGNNLAGDRITITDGTMCVSESEYKALRKNLTDRTLLLSINGTIGNLAFYNGERVVLGKSAAYINVAKGVSRTFISYCLKSRSTFLFFENELTGTTIRNLSLQSLRNTPIPVPPTIEEQRAIARALEDADALIGALTKLIAKKRDLKQAAVQQLLTGRQAPPGFHAEWEVKRLGDVLKVRHGKSQQEVAVRGGAYPILATSGEIGRTNHYLYDKPSVLIGRKGTIDAPQYVDTPFWTIDTLFFTEIKLDASPKFIFYKFQTINWRNYNEASGVPSLNASTIEGIEIQLPTISQQEAIAIVLSDMDVELSSLEQRRDKTRAIKQGMMQELLTGRTRLVSSEAASLPQKEKRAVAKPNSHNWEINEAVVISVLAKQFGSERFPLGRKRYTKLSYLLHRHVEKEPEGYLKKAAGPYNPRTKYKGPEGIAQRNGYVRTHANGQYSGFVAADNIGNAEEYFQRWYGPETLQWIEQFRFSTNDELELLATVDMAVRDLQNTREGISLQRVKDVIRSHPEWEAKLTRPVFADANITAAMKTCEELFN